MGWSHRRMEDHAEEDGKAYNKKCYQWSNNSLSISWIWMQQGYPLHASDWLVRDTLAAVTSLPWLGVSSELDPKWAYPFLPPSFQEIFRHLPSLLLWIILSFLSIIPYLSLFLHSLLLISQFKKRTKGTSGQSRTSGSFNIMVFSLDF